jgi:hypothetical protein
MSRESGGQKVIKVMVTAAMPLLGKSRSLPFTALYFEEDRKN